VQDSICTGVYKDLAYLLSGPNRLLIAKELWFNRHKNRLKACFNKKLICLISIEQTLWIMWSKEPWYRLNMIIVYVITFLVVYGTLVDIMIVMESIICPTYYEMIVLIRKGRQDINEWRNPFRHGQRTWKKR
jgi:hypothetical protein